jgi:NADH:ubiquinone oxidoreductase subunit 2 (subunit N)
MLFSSMSEIDLLLGLIMLVLYGLFSLRSKLVSIADVHFFCRTWLILVLFSFLVDGTDVFNAPSLTDALLNNSLLMDALLAVLTITVLSSFSSSFESTLLLLLAFVGQMGLLHSCDLVSFFICLEVQNFAFLVLCGLQPATNSSPFYSKGSSGFSVEAALKFALLSAFSSGVLLFWFSALYLRTGSSFLFFKTASYSILGLSPINFILLALMFKLGAAPLHLWVVDIYGSVKRSLLMYISTVPKLSLFGFWVSSWHGVWTDFSVALFALFSLALGTFGAYGQPALRALFAYSTVNEIGILLMAVETAGFHSLFQHLFIYILTQFLLWNLSDKRLFTMIAVSLAGMPPLLGFFGKAWIFSHVASTNLTFVLMVALFTTGVSLVYYIRVIRLFWSKYSYDTINNIDNGLVGSLSRSVGVTSSSLCYSMGSSSLSVNRIYLTSAVAVFLVFGPIFFVKPFVL